MDNHQAGMDVLCVGHACYDLTFSVPHHLSADEKIFADNLVSCGGGPAANAAVAIAKLGFNAAFAGYLGQDIYGQLHFQEFETHHVDTRLIIRGDSPTPVSTVVVKPDGKRALINYKGSTRPLTADALDFSAIHTRAILFDGHEPHLSQALLYLAQEKEIPTILDAGSLHEGTSFLWDKVDYLVASEKFVRQFAGDVQSALAYLAKKSPCVVITLGEKGLIWQKGAETGQLPAPPNIKAIDTTGAGDAFHGAFSAAVATGMDWQEVLSYASVAGALCCTKMGARCGLPSKLEQADFIFNQYGLR